MDSRYYGISEALSLLFGSNILANVPSLRTKANSFLRNGVLNFKADLITHNNKNVIPESELDTLFNAMLLSSIFTNSKEVKAIFCEAAKRQQCAGIVKAMFTRQHSLAGIALSSSKATAFVTCLEGGVDLRANRLPNPEAKALIDQLDANASGVAELKAEIDKKIHEAEEVDDLLDFMRGL